MIPGATALRPDSRNDQKRAIKASAQAELQM
jgi:hypothetical protein